MSMNIITAPSVYMVGHQTVNEGELGWLMNDLEVVWESDSEVAAEVITESAGRICYMSFVKPRPGGNAAYLQHIKEVGHGSVLEHAVFNFVFTGVSRSLTHELVRHRAGFGYSQLSQRYVDESVAEYIVPEDLREEVERAIEWMRARGPLDREGIEHAMRRSIEWAGPDEALAAGLFWLRSVARASADYGFLSNYLANKFKPELERRYDADPTLNAGDPDLRTSDLGLITAGKTERRKRARQAARSVLPNATETKIAVTANARALRHFLEQRGSRHADPEIRKLAYQVLKHLKGHSPNLFGDYVETPLPDGTVELTTPYPKV